jgi:hypothetical protein
MILVFGIDGFGWAWEEKLRERGWYTAPMFSPHAQSPPAWNSLMSGLTAETHQFQGLPLKGVRDLGRGRIKYLWDHLGAAGKAAVVVGVPFIFPPMLINRLMVCGYPAEPTNYVFPKSAASRWPFRFRDLVAWHRGKDPHGFHTVPDDELLHQARQSRRRQAHAFRQELAEGCDVGILSFTDLDRLSHAAYESMQDEAIRNGVIDELLGLIQQIVAGHQPDWAFIVSDHGIDFTAEPPSMVGDDYWRQTHGVDKGDTRIATFAYRGRGDRAAPMMPNGERAGDTWNLNQIDRLAQLEDLVPTILYLLDITPRWPLEGQARTEIVAGEIVNEAAITEQLERLGYM